jgi:hypothetical protein
MMTLPTWSQASQIWADKSSMCPTSRISTGTPALQHAGGNFCRSSTTSAVNVDR